MLHMSHVMLLWFSLCYCTIVEMMNDCYADIQLLTNIRSYKLSMLHHDNPKKLSVKSSSPYWLIFLIFVMGTSNKNINIVHLSNEHTKANLINCFWRLFCPKGIKNGFHLKYFPLAFLHKVI